MTKKNLKDPRGDEDTNTQKILENIDRNVCVFRTHLSKVKSAKLHLMRLLKFVKKKRERNL